MSTMQKHFVQRPPGAGAVPIVAFDRTEAYTVLSGSIGAGALLLCDHACNAFPAGYETLGLAEAELDRHIAYDIGALAVTRAMAEALGAPAIHTHYSRLLIDPNRGADDPTLIMRLSDGAVIPGNRGLDAAERAKRIGAYYRPYHARIDALIDTYLQSGITPVLVSMHSFTDNWKGVPRPWHVSVLWDRDPRFAVPLLQALSAEGDLIVGDNEPYHGALEGDCMWQHGTMRGLPHAIIEVRQDLIGDVQGQTAWGERLSRIISAILAREDLRAELRQVRHFS
jgi:predicted N-formylglutamate amidohydrolase